MTLQKTAFVAAALALLLSAVGVAGYRAMRAAAARPLPNGGPSANAVPPSGQPAPGATTGATSSGTGGGANGSTTPSSPAGEMSPVPGSAVPAGDAAAPRPIRGAAATGYPSGAPGLPCGDPPAFTQQVGKLTVTTCARNHRWDWINGAWTEDIGLDPH